MCFAPQRRALFRHLNCQKWSAPGVFCTFWLRNVLCATTACTFQHLNCQRGSEPLVFLTFWLQNVLRATTACTFSRSELPKVVRTPCVFNILTSNVLRATTACTFSTSQLPKVVRTWCVLCILTSNVLRATTACNFSSLIWPAGSAPAALASLLFDPPEPQIIGKTQCLTTFLPFRASASSFFILFFLLIFLFSLPFPFHLSILSEVWLLNFLRIFKYI